MTDTQKTAANQTGGHFFEKIPQTVLRHVFWDNPLKIKQLLYKARSIEKVLRAFILPPVQLFR